MALALVYLLAARLAPRAEAVWSSRRLLSTAAGISVTYVFVDVLPELGVRHRQFVAAAGQDLLFAEQRIYTLALLSFVVLYGLEHMVLVARERDGDDPRARPRDALYWLHIGGFVAYSGLIGYLLVERTETGSAALALYATAMAVHFRIIDHSLHEHHGRTYGTGGRATLAASVLAGWLVGVATPLSGSLVARLFAVLAGGVVITSLRAELPEGREGRFWPFCLGAAAYTLLLQLAT